MPSKGDNPIIGTYQCHKCETVASVYQAKRGKVKNLLYVRCGCGCDQRTGEAVQRQIRTRMTPKPGYEDLSIEPEQKPDTVPAKTTEEEPKSEPKKKGGGLVFLAVLGVLGAIAAVARS